MVFNPFRKDIGEPLDANDLHELIARCVTEGLYVEYKSAFPTNEKIARSIGSFANSYGGWYFVGIDADKINNAPISINDILVKDFPDVLSKVRDSVKAHLSPVPAIYPQIVSVNADSVVAVVRIPGRQDKPFISSNGRIYRRVADSSEPLFENDRYVIDKLYAEGREFESDFEDFCRDETSHNVAEYQGALIMFVAPYPETAGTSDIFNLDYAESLLQRSRVTRRVPMFWVPDTTGSVDLVASQPTHESVILRSGDPAQLQGLFASIELFLSGRCKIELPLTFFPRETWKQLDKLKSLTAQTILQTFQDNNPDEFLLIRLLDVGEVMGGVGTLLSFYLDWLGSLDRFTDFRLVAKVTGVDRVIPFFDSDEWAEHANRFRLPIVTRDRIRIPRGRHPFNHQTDSAITLHQMVCFLIGNALGMPFELQGSAFINKYGTDNSV